MGEGRLLCTGCAYVERKPGQRCKVCGRVGVDAEQERMALKRLRETPGSVVRDVTEAMRRGVARSGE